MEKRTRSGILIVAVALAGAVPGCATQSSDRSEDQHTTAEVRALLGQHTEFSAPNRVYADTTGGVVYLSGQVATGLQRSDAEDLAREASGGKRVVDMISLFYR